MNRGLPWARSRIRPHRSRRSGERCGGDGVQRAELDEHPIGGEAQPSGAAKFWTCSRDDKQRQIDAEREPIQEPDQLAVGPVHVLDPHDQRPHPGERPEVAKPSVRDLVPSLVERAGGELRAARDAGAVTDRRRDTRSLGRVGEALGHSGDQVLPAMIERACEELTERRVGSRLVAGAAARHKNASIVPVTRDEFLDQPRLALARRASHEGERALPRACPVERVAQLLVLDVASDEHRARAIGRNAHSRERARPSRADALELALAEVGEFSQVFGCRTAGRPDENLPWLGERLQAGGDVDTRADGHPLAFVLGRVQIEERLAGLDTHSYHQRIRDRACAGLRCSERAFWIIGVSDRRAEDREHGIPDVLLDDSTAAHHDRVDLCEARVELAARAFRADADHQLRRADDVHEHGRDEPPFRSMLRQSMWPEFTVRRCGQSAPLLGTTRGGDAAASAHRRAGSLITQLSNQRLARAGRERDQAKGVGRPRYGPVGIGRRPSHARTLITMKTTKTLATVPMTPSIIVRGERAQPRRGAPPRRLARDTATCHGHVNQ